MNDTAFEMDGVGKIVSPGVYQASIHFSEIPDGLYPTPIATLAISSSCVGVASTRNGAMNMEERGVTGYESTRTITADDVSLKVGAKSTYGADCLSMDVRVDGEADLPEDMIGHSSYFVKLEPTEAGVAGVGDLTLSRDENLNLETRLDSEYTDLEPEKLRHPFTDTQYRVVTESGNLDGNTYTSTIHTTLQGTDPIEAIEDLESEFV
ncbi:hypothetical protein C478_01980 [Natrinema thermotolerans DSM 11552]|uniref:hypothetical protein n=1 Tax=Natrinema sp. H-ect1 TaxID=3242700 RepID=UPI0002AFAA4B|nr:hypothetical protein C478_01980 [Natrinema thermotolerans DSM 11552]